MIETKRAAAIVALGVLGAIACSDGVDMMGDAMVDAGEALSDAGEAMLDASGDADAQVPPASYDATCEPHTVEQISDRDSGTVIDETTHYYAEANVPGLTPDTVETALAVMCDRVVPGIPPESCPADRTCERTPVPVFDCDSATPQVTAGRVRVRCGTTRTLRSIDGTMMSTIGEHWSRVRFVVR